MLGRLWHSSIAIAAVLAACGDNQERPGSDNLPPTLAAFALTTSEDTPVTAMIPATDPDGDTLTFAFGTAAHGTVTGTGTSLTYTPAANYTGTDSFLVTASDGFGTASAMVTVTISPVNDGPTATDDQFATPEDVALTVTFAQLVANDTDPDGDTLTITAVDGATNGTVTLHANTNTVEFTPTANFEGTGTFTYTVSDGTATDIATVTVTVGGENDPPIAVDDTANTDEDVALVIAAATLLGNDSDPDGQTVTITGVDNPTNGTVSMSGTDITFTPDANFNGIATFEYTASDGALTDVAQVRITVAPINDAPVAANDQASTNEDVAVVIPAADLLANDTDAENDPLTVASVANVTHGTVSMTGTDITFTPAAGFSGNATFEYTVTDGDLTDTALVTVEVGAVNDAPTAGNDQVTTLEDTTLVIPKADLLANDTDSDGPQPLDIVGVQNATNGAVSLTGSSITFIPEPNFAGTATFEYAVTDGALESIATVTVTVTPVNDAPVAVNDSASTNEDTELVLAASTLLANDTDVDLDTLSIDSVSNAVNGTVGLTGTTITFTPTANFFGTARFDYTITDGALTSTATVTIAVAAVNDAPVANPDSATVNEDATLVLMAGALLANDTDTENDALTITGVSNAVNGSVVLDDTTITFTPTADFFGTASFNYTITDGALTSTATVTIEVASVNDAPVAGNDSVTALGGQANTYTAASLLSNDTDVDGPVALSITGVGNATNGTVALDAGIITFTPSVLTGQASFEYTVWDSLDLATAVVTVTISDPCGNGDLDAGEACDDGDNEGGDGCSATCTVEAGFTCAGSPSACTTTCGDGIIAGAEVCDDGNNVSDDGCTSCAVDRGYTCSGAVSECATTCGDGIIAGEEQCDDGGATGGNGCSATCVEEPGYMCVNEPSECLTVCGDGVLTSDEDCDDGNLVDTDGCTSECFEGAVCNVTKFPGGDRFTVDPFTGNCYVAYDNEPTAHAAAATACTASGGYLVTITSDEEQSIVDAVMDATQQLWIGATDAALEGTFVWGTGETFAFTHFAEHQPDGAAAENCLYANADGEWGDASCTASMSVTGRVCEYELTVCGDGVIDAGEQCDDGNNNDGDGCSTTCQLTTPFFSEYVEGSGNNKAVEIRNPSSTASFNLAGCQLRTYANGATSSTDLPLTGVIAANDVFVVCNSSASFAGSGGPCDLKSSSNALTYNGNDAVELFCNGRTYDVIGQIGSPFPATEWGTGLASTADNTLRRKCTVLTGDTNGSNTFSPAVEWDGFATDTFTGLGVNECL
jgi:cysteine-rich repeat protein